MELTVMPGLFDADLIEFWQKTGDPFIIGSKQQYGLGDLVHVNEHPLRVMREVTWEDFLLRYADLPPEYEFVHYSIWPHFYEVATD